MSGVEEGGGEPSSGIPPTKKAPPVYHRRSLHGSLICPLTSSAACYSNKGHISEAGGKGKRRVSKKPKFFTCCKPHPNRRLQTSRAPRPFHRLRLPIARFATRPPLK